MQSTDKQHLLQTLHFENKQFCWKLVLWKLHSNWSFTIVHQTISAWQRKKKKNRFKMFVGAQNHQVIFLFVYCKKFQFRERPFFNHLFHNECSCNLVSSKQKKLVQILYCLCKNKDGLQSVLLYNCQVGLMKCATWWTTCQTNTVQLFYFHSTSLTLECYLKAFSFKLPKLQSF